MHQETEGASEAVEAIKFSFMTNEEVRRQSLVKVTNPVLVDLLGHPTPGGLYDPAMGPNDDRSLCKSCGQSSFNCPGHCGHIDLVSPVYNPLTFGILSLLLHKACMYCFHFRASREEVETCASQLRLIAKGDILGARRLSEAGREAKQSGESSSDECVDQDAVDCMGSHMSGLTDEFNFQDHPDSIKHQPYWDNFLFTEFMEVWYKFLKSKPKASECNICNAKNPKISKPTFGWFHMSGMKNKALRDNIIGGHKLEGWMTFQANENSTSEVVDDFETAETNSFMTTSDGIDKPTTKGNNEETVSHQFEEQKRIIAEPLLPSQIRDVMKLLWENEASICSFICDIQCQNLKKPSMEAWLSIFFLEVILVPPIKFRPAAKGGDSVMDHPHTVLLNKVLQSNIALRNTHVNTAERPKIISRLMELQQSINVLFDSKTATGKKDVSPGICQLLEKKEGIFRQKMMGKRVNYACRSVISPDPYLAVNEIGVPPYFAVRLTYPERVTPWNAARLRDAITNGPDIYPGAVSYSDRVSKYKLPPSRRMRLAISRKLPSSRGVLIQSGKNSDYEFEGKVVYRHLQDGDIVLVNRQPTLHKPSIMAHVVRVLKGEKTLRMHYANCSSYNADFDGDEMNVHFPQDEVSRAEAYNIVNANEQYIVPTKGDTVRGLIQDHIVSAVILTMKNTFLTLDEFNQLLYASGVSMVGHRSFSGDNSLRVSTVDSESSLHPILPAVWKPKPLWTGKQVITAVLNHLTRGFAPCSIRSKGKIPEKYFSKDRDSTADSKLVIWKNELVRGVIDKAQFGKYGLVHTFQELYGSNVAGNLLSTLSRLFTIFLQTHGFTCGVDDLIILPDYDSQRKEQLESEDVGEEVHANFVKFKPGEIGPAELQLEIEKAISIDKENAIASLDMRMKNQLNKKAKNMDKDLLLKGLLRPFPKNCISLMTVTGAKGSTVNFQQISSYLGQQELEGKRVPRMVSGKTLPCFSPWDFTSRAGGFITDRFLTGLRPQEYYFHCMAGREGLVDTAVKTSRSGYLQRCLVKNLESLKVCYDYTVRDADGSVIQFYYGEDAVDVHRTSFLKNFKALQKNEETIRQKFRHAREFDSYINKLPDGLEEEVKKFLMGRKVKVDGKLNKALSKRFAKENLKQSEGKNKLAAFLKLVEQKYLYSLVQSGEPVGVIAAQSIGEPSTQMTLNTFHLAGRGEMNVTLGIPRLQEILTTASEVIKTPFLSCPFLGWTTRDEARALLAKVMKITVADVIESMEVRITPLIVKDTISQVFKLIVKLKKHDFVSLKDCQRTLRTTFLRALEDAIENHLVLLSKISGIKYFKSSSQQSVALNGPDADASCSESQVDTAGDDSEEEEDRADDLGSDAQKQKGQTTDEVDYDDEESDHETAEEDSPSSKMGKDEAEDAAIRVEEEAVEFDCEGEDTESSKTKSRQKNTKSTFKQKPEKEKYLQKDSDRAIYKAVKGLFFEVHFNFTNEPHILLAQVAEKTAKKVYIKSSGNIHQCKMVNYEVGENTVLWDGEKTEKAKGLQKDDSNDAPLYWALKAGGIDFGALWELQDKLDVSRIYSNNIYAMLRTYGVEAARATIIREVKTVFGIYGVEIDYRHMSLIADYMTHTGGYTALSRHGRIGDSFSPFLKMSFETASKFIVEAASQGMIDTLETPSSRLCVGLPVKMGTGSFDLMQKLEIDAH
ncbi:hypothetical protein DM860_005298 [Cuscuta australis]|uniref:DNA-directed RNA polymerase subunit n=1 Tax=Cuscuta australis TaxID=267555 RepID=A0A328DZ00_9ASTE|nr:hypothetical protein DM860_005298 [Cuscuta australis]